MSNWKRAAALLDIPDLPREAFQHVGDYKIKPQGGDQAAAPSSQTVTQTSIPDYARPYVETMLGKAQSAADQPYQTYGGQRIADATGLQQQSYQAAQGLNPGQDLNQAASMAGQAGLGALNTSYTPGQFNGGTFDQNAAQQYMSPYMQSVVDVQQREAQRQADIAGTQRNAQAVGAGAFGGSRQAIMDAEAARNLATQKGDIQAQGLQSAYTNAQSQFNADQARGLQANQLGEQSRQYGAGLGLQGLQTSLQGASTLGNLGNQALTTQNQLGTQQQQQQQQGLSQQYQDFLNQQNYPFKQIGFMSDLLRGTPSNTSSTLYSAPPSTLGQVAGLGTAALGASKLFKKGGAVKKRPAGLAELAVHRMAGAHA